GEQFLQRPGLVNARALFSPSQRPTLAGTALSAGTDDPLVGQMLGAYRIEGRLGQGGMGVVYLAEDTLLKRRVAIKVLPRSAQEDVSSVRRFLREAQAVALLNHPNIVAIYHVDQWAGGHSLVLEFMAGGSLQARLHRSGALAWPEATRAVID